MNKIELLLPILIYLLINIFIVIFITKKDRKNTKNFINNYYIGNRSLGSFVLAMTIVSTYIGASSFIGGPSIAYNVGLSWVLLACIQIPVVFLTLGVLGKKLAIISRKINALTIIDVLRVRYKSEVLIFLLSILLLIFLIASIIAQFIGGARLFETIIGIDYKLALTIFSSIVIFYTVFGGFKAVTITDAIQGMIMMLSSSILFFIIVYKLGGINIAINKIYEIDPMLLSPNGVKQPFILSFWILVGIAILGLPATAVRTMAFKDTKSLHKAILIGTFVVGFLLISMHLVGFISRASDISFDSSDKLIPLLALKYLHPVLAGIFIAGPLAAIMSTVDSLLIIVSSSIVKDIYINYINPNQNENKIKKISIMISLSIGLIVYILSLKPINLIVWINLFALSGQEVLFFIPLIMGLFWEKGNSKAAIFSVVTGFIVFISLEIYKFSFFGMHNIVLPLIVSFVTYILVSIIYKEELDEKTKNIFLVNKNEEMNILHFFVV